MIPPAPSEARPTAIGRVLVLCGLVAATTARAEDWPRFRGPDGTGVAENTGIPDTWTDADYAWVVDLPGEGHGSPVVADGRLSIAYTSSTGRAKGSGLVVLDVASGSEIWRRTIAFRPAGLHRQNGFASWSPAVGGGLTVVSVADPNGHSVTGIDLDVTAGETQPRAWSRDFPGQDSTHGFGSSPAVVTAAPGGNPLAIIPVDHLGPSRLVALDAKTGGVVWEAERPAGEKSAYATPLVLRDGAGVPTAVVASSSSAGVRAYDVRDGAELWSTPPMPARVVASPILAGDLVIQTCGGGGAGKALWAIDRDTGEIRHRLRKRLPYVPTPVAYD
ncbi:MAG: PQQ-binding-like beta-propeller repeat protein, partial [Planctomycetota bacterium]